jgi:SAM-dependent methyltransferase
MATILTEVYEDFASLSAWQEWRAANQQAVSRPTIDAIVAEILAAGIVEPLTNLPIAGAAIIGTDNLREGLAYLGVNSRSRGVLLAIQRTFAGHNPNTLRVYAAEALTSFASRLRFVYPGFIGSEFAQTEAEVARLLPIRSEDLGALSFGDATFDLVSTNEVLEHVPSIDQCLREIARVLVPGGWHIGTVPFRFNSPDSQVKAKLVNGQLVHLVETPEYHGNPMRAEGSLVFELPGWDILDRCRAAGFASASMKYIVSRRHGCLTADAGGIFVLCAQR